MDIALNRINDEVFVATEEIVRLDARAIELVRKHAMQNARGRARICTHKALTDPVHEMVIAIRSDSYIRPHRHCSKTESFHLIDGEGQIAILTDEGEVADVVALGPGRNFYYRLDSPRYHTLLINSPVLVIHETTNGPFAPGQADLAPFSPVEEDRATAADYIDRLRLMVASWKR